MTHVGAPVAARTETAAVSFVDWGAVFAGAVLAAALSFVLLTFGTAIGLSATSPWPNSGLSAKVIATLAVFWVIAQQIGSLMAGGYVAGRMRSRWLEPGHEAAFRDGLHGGLVWAVAVLLSAFLVFATAGLIARTAPRKPGEHGLGQYEAMIAACHAAGFSPRIGQEAPRISSTLSLVAVGLGICLIPASLARMNMDGVTYLRLRVMKRHVCRLVGTAEVPQKADRIAAEDFGLEPEADQELRTKEKGCEGVARFPPCQSSRVSV